MWTTADNVQNMKPVQHLHRFHILYFFVRFIFFYILHRFHILYSLHRFHFFYFLHRFHILYILHRFHILYILHRLHILYILRDCNSKIELSNACWEACSLNMLPAQSWKYWKSAYGFWLHNWSNWLSPTISTFNRWRTDFGLWVAGYPLLAWVL